MNRLEQIREVLRQVKFPHGVVAAEVTGVGEDHAGYPAAYIELTIADSVWSEEWSRQNTDAIRQPIYDAFEKAGMAEWPYAYVRTESEQAELRAIEANA